MRALLAAALFASALPAAAQDPMAPFCTRPRAQVLLLGVFHFQDAGLDSYRPQFPLDIRDEKRQRELEEVISRLAAWKPTRIAIERRPERQQALDSMFALYPGGGIDTLRNEIYQIGFRLAKRLGLPGVNAVDAAPRRLDSAMTQEEWNRQQRALARGPLSATNWDANYRVLYRSEDSLKTVRTLRETLIAEGDPERIRVGHGAYLVNNLLHGTPGEYFGADGFVSAWHNRNIRIYSNVVRLIRSPEERVLVILGAGHMPILQHLFQSSRVVQLNDVRDVLR
ncbi:MAG: DUF5694 domain-containing protein [Gemmatimonadaceae bacterium]